MKHSKVKQHIIETASHLFYHNGYNLTGINEIIKEAGIAKATLYNHFPSKDDICIAYLQYKNTTFLSEIRIFALGHPEGKDRILALFDFLEKFFNNVDFNGCWCINTVSEIPKEKEKIRMEIKNGKRQLLQLIEKLVWDNTPIKGDGVVQLAQQIYLLYEGAIAEAHLHQEKWPIISAKQMCSRLLN